MTLFVRIVSIAALTSMSAATVAAFIPQAARVQDEAIIAREAIAAPLPATDGKAGPSLLERSPFARDRSAFARNLGPPAPEVEVKLSGIFKMGKEMRASLLVGGQTVVVGKGDDTPVGVVTVIDASSVTIEGATTRRLDLFKP